MFVDEAQINVRGGDGGAGCMSFLREAHRPKGGPDGGDGGRGGDVYLVADASVSTLVRFTKEIHFRAESGTHGEGKERHGRTGRDLRIMVPLGTTVRDPDGTLLADLVGPGDAYQAAHGGRGGRGNKRFLSNRHRAPRFAEQGEPGEEHWIRIELRLLADVALVGFPNAGKSTLIASVSAARPKIADYPFTTLTPNLGVATADERDLVIADVPGLIEGAAEGRGLGHQFLRHVERAHVLLVLLDPMNPDHMPDEQYRVLLDELGRYEPRLLARPRIVALSKCDTVDTETVDLVRASLQLGAEREFHAVSAVTHQGLTTLVRACADAVDSARAVAPPTTGYVVHRPRSRGFSVYREGSRWVVDGPDVRRSVALNDLTDEQAVAYVQEGLRRLGVFEALEAAGCRSGDDVRIGELDFEFAPDVAGESGPEVDGDD
ncbi:MAG: GTPase ObgE [Acidimicrobiia bacterium]